MTEDRMNRVWARGLQHASDLLIKRGSAMGSLLPLLFLVPCFLLFAWLFKELLALAIPLGLVAVGIVVEYCRQFSGFAKHDPDRLQSEEYRYEMKKIQLIAAKELPYPMTVESLDLLRATSNPAHPLPSKVDEQEPVK